MKKILFFLAIFCLSFTFQSDKMNVMVLSVNLDYSLYDYFCVDSTYDYKTNTANLKVLYAEKNRNIRLIQNEKYEVEFMKWNPSKMIIGNDTLNHRGSCLLDFGNKIIDNCGEMKYKEKLKRGKECMIKEIEYYEILKDTIS